MSTIWRSKIAKVNVEKRLVTVWYSQVTDEDGKPIEDSQGDMINISELEDADIEAFADGGLRKGGEMHAKIGGVDVVQHFTLSNEERERLKFGKGAEGGIAKLRVNDNELWQKIKNGDYTDVSIAGDAIREKVE